MKQRIVVFALVLLGTAFIVGSIARFGAASFQGFGSSQMPGGATVLFAPTMVSPLPKPKEVQEVTLGNWTYRFRLAAQGLVSGRAPFIIDFLPDGRTLSVLLSSASKDREESLEVAALNTDTGLASPYGFTPVNAPPRRPVWLEGVQSMAIMQPDSLAHNSGELSYSLWLLQAGEARADQVVASDIGAVVGRDTELILVESASGRMILTDLISGQQRTLVEDTRKLGIDPTDYHLQTVIHQRAPLVAVFGRTGLAIVDTSTGETKAVTLGTDTTEEYFGERWVLNAYWNPTSTELALEIAVGETPLASTRLFVLDTGSGALTQIAVPRRWVMDAAWAPNGKHIFVMGSEAIDAKSAPLLIDVDSRQVVEVIVQPALFYDGLSEWGLAWSMDGSRIAVVQGNAITTLDVEITENQVLQ